MAVAIDGRNTERGQAYSDAETARERIGYAGGLVAQSFGVSVDREQHVFSEANQLFRTYRISKPNSSQNALTALLARGLARCAQPFLIFMQTVHHHCRHRRAHHRQDRPNSPLIACIETESQMNYRGKRYEYGRRCSARRAPIMQPPARCESERLHFPFAVCHCA